MIFIMLTLCLLSIGIIEGKLRDKSELQTHCYHFPSLDFGKPNNVKETYGSSPKLILNVGDDAIDFTLADPNGKEVSLNLLLKEKPVVMIWGHYTCPAFQGYKSDIMFLGSSYSEEYKLIDAYGDDVYFLHMIGPEPHPIWPHANFDSGSLKMNYWSTISQPQTYEERLEVSVKKIEPYTHSKSIILADRLDGKNGIYNNPVWCSYANGARSAFLIDKQGVIQAAQTWFKKDDLEASIHAIL